MPVTVSTRLALLCAIPESSLQQGQERRGSAHSGGVLGPRARQLGALGWVRSSTLYRLFLCGSMTPLVGQKSKRKRFKEALREESCFYKGANVSLHVAWAAVSARGRGPKPSLLSCVFLHSKSRQSRPRAG